MGIMDVYERSCEAIPPKKVEEKGGGGGEGFFLISCKWCPASISC